MSRLFSDPIERFNLTLSASAVAASLALAPPMFTVSLATGAAIEAANFRALRRAGKRLFSGDLTGGFAWSALFGLRFLFLGLAMYVALSAGANPFGLVLGLSLIVPSAIWVSWRQVPPVPEAGSFEVPAPDDPIWDDWNPWLACERNPSDESDEAQ